MNVLKKIKSYRKEWEEIRQEKFLFMNSTPYRKRCMRYAKAYNEKRVNPNMVLYESFWGRGMIDNPYALFKEVLHRKEYKHLQHVWVLDDFEDNRLVIEKYKEYPNVRFVLFSEDDYLEALAEAKYLVNNTTFQNFFVKKDEQVYINTWHGTPLKSMGYEMTDGNSGSANIVRNFLASDYLLSANETMTKMYLRSYKLQEIMPGKIIEEGYPRNDSLSNVPREQVKKSLEDRGICLEEGKKVILFAPTWREVNSGQAIINPQELLEVKEVLDKNIDRDKYQILIKPHQLVYKFLKNMEEYRGLLIPSTIDTNEVLSIVDVLISDYSSIFLDYMVLNRPVLFYIPDLSNYKEKRGLDVKPEDLPGPCSDNLQDIAGYIRSLDQIQKKYKNVYNHMRQNVCGHEDGSVSARIVDIIFGNRQEYNEIKAVSTKKRLLLSTGGVQDNGIGHSFLSLLEQIDYDEWDVTALVAQAPNDERMRYKINHMNQNVRVLVKCGQHIATYEEEVKRVFATARGVNLKIWEKYYPWHVMHREFRRCFGMAEFDYIVDFQGYNPLLAAILAQGKAKKKSIWLHSDIQADMNRKVNGEKPIWKALHFTTSLYSKFDNVVSCSHSVMEVNRKNLSTPQTYDKFTYAKNTVNAIRIKKCLEDTSEIKVEGRKYLIKNQIDESEASRKLDLVEFPREDCVNFVTMGRLSTEKNHVALIKAFARLHGEHKNVRLYILGDGPLRAKVEKTISFLGMDDAVVLTGNISNPFAMMKQCSCFILPSLHEGQPMVLLEARACGLPIIVSEFSTVKDSLYPEGQLVIGTDEDSIYQGLKDFLEGKVPVCEFDLDDYNREAYEEFVKAIQ